MARLSSLEMLVSKVVTNEQPLAAVEREGGATLFACRPETLLRTGVVARLILHSRVVVRSRCAVQSLHRNKSRLIKLLMDRRIYEQSCESYKLLPSSRRRRLLAGGNSDLVAIERNGPVDRGRLISHDQPVRVLACARDAVVAPNVVRFAIQKVDRLHLTRVKDWYEEIADRAHVLDIEDQPVRRSLRNAHAVSGFARKVIDLFKVEYLAFLHLIGPEVFAALIQLQAGQSVGLQN
jgi:hypothetical protein